MSEKLTPEVLATVRVLWRQDDTLTLWGIPYLMQEGQAPRDLVRARQDQIAHNARVRPGTRLGWQPVGPIPEGWVWLGQPGWYGNLDAEEQALLNAFLKKHADFIPQGPMEWNVLPTP